jgi:hypothetical protein
MIFARDVQADLAKDASRELGLSAKPDLAVEIYLQ